MNKPRFLNSINFTSFYGLFAIILVIIGIFIGLTPFHPPEANDYKGVEAEVSLEEVKNHLEAIAQAPHPVGSPEHERVKNYLIETLEEMGLAVEIQDTITYAPGVNTSSSVQNIMTRIDGTNPTGTVMLAAHYDTSFVSPGASDDGYGVAALLEAARLLKDKPLKNNLIILITDAEELGLIGAHAFVKEHPWAKEVDLVLNFEARGNTGSTVMFETSNGNKNLIKEFQEATNYPASNSFLKEVYDVMPNGTDLTEFVRTGMQALNFASAQGFNGYHTTIDSLAFMNEDTVMHHATYAYALANHFTNIDLSRIENNTEDNAVYFNVFGHTLVSYSESFVLPLFILVLLGYIATMYHGIRKKTISIGGTFIGFLLFLLSLVVTYGFTLAVWKGVSSLLKAKAWLLTYDQQIAGVYLVGFLFLTAAVLIVFTYLLQKKITAIHMVAGALFGWTLIAGYVSFVMPGASYLFVWPLVFTLIGTNLLLWKKHSKNTKALLYITLCIPGIVLYTFLVNAIHLALTINVIYTVMVVATISFMLFIPIFSTFAGSWKYGLGLLLLGAGILTYQSATLEATDEHPIGNEVYYFADADVEKAVWATNAKPDSFTSQFVPKGTMIGELNLDPVFNNVHDMYAVEAPFYDEHVPQSELLSDVTENGKRTITLNIQSPDAVNLSFITKNDLTIHELKINNIEQEIVAGFYEKEYPFSINFAGLSNGFELSITINEGETLDFYLIHNGFHIPAIFNYEKRPANMTTHRDLYEIAKSYQY